jgi:uncharacterized protein
MRSMRRPLLVLAAALLFSGAAAHADDASKHAKVKQLFELTSMQNRVDQIRVSALAQARSFAAQQFASTGVSAQQDNKGVAAFYDRLNALVAGNYNWTKLEPAYEQIYANLYTEDELDGILAFYKSPVGQAFLSKSPEATRQILQLSKQQFDTLTPQIQKLTQDYVAHLKVHPKSQP